MKLRKLFVCVLSVVVMAAVAVPAMAQDKKKKEAPPPPEQFVPVLTYKTGPFAAGGSGFAGGWEDYMALLNLRDKGINGVMLKWEECDFGYNTERGVEWLYPANDRILLVR